MDDLIYRGKLLAAYDAAHKGPPGGARKLIAEASAVEAIPVRRGRWIDMGDATVVCSECNNQIVGEPDYAFCPCCGADMREVEKDD